MADPTENLTNNTEVTPYNKEATAPVIPGVVNKRETQPGISSKITLDIPITKILATPLPSSTHRNMNNFTRNICWLSKIVSTRVIKEYFLGFLLYWVNKDFYT